MKIDSLFLSLFLFLGCVQPEINETASAPNSNPVIKNLSAAPLSSVVGEIVTVTAEVDDPDGDALSYEWYMTAGDISGNGPVVRYVATYCCLGVNTVRVTVKDGRGGSATKAVDVLVQRQ